MNIGSWLVWLIPAGTFIGLAMAAILLGWLQYRLAGLVAPHTRIAAALVLIGLGALLSVALTSRVLDESVLERGGVVLYEDYASGFAASRWLSLLLLAAALVEIARGWLRRRATRVHDPAWPLLVALLLFYAGTAVIQAALSEHSGFSHKEMYVPILLLAIYYQPIDDLRRVLGAAKLAVLALVLGSLAGIVVRPDFVLHRPDAGVIPGIDWRLFGLTPHANTLGPIALLGLILGLYSPYGRRALRWLFISACVVVLVLAQSRTAWAAGLLIAVLVKVPMLLTPGATLAARASAFRRAAWTAVACIGLLIALVCALGFAVGSDYLQRKTELGTLNGRFQIWEITLQAWNENVLFGYGPEVWGPERRLRFNMFHVGQAHNQAVQTLGEAGAVGLGLLALYLLTLTVAAVRRFTASRGLVLALLMLLLARCVTEAPMRSEGLLSWPTFLHSLLLLAACHFLRQRSAPDAVRAERAVGSHGFSARQVRAAGPRYHVAAVAVAGALVTKGRSRAGRGLLAGAMMLFAPAATRAADLYDIHASPRARVVQSSYFCTHLHRGVAGDGAGARSRATPWPEKQLGALRLWDTGTRWADIEPAPGVYRFERLDAYIALAQRHAAEPLMVLGSAPRWAAARPDEAGPYGPGSASEPARLDDWERYVTALARRYKGRIGRYELWNEPYFSDLPADRGQASAFFTGSVGAMTELARRTRAVLDREDPVALLLTPGFVGGPQRLDMFLDAGGGRSVDGVAYHFYADDDRGFIDLYRQVRAVMARHRLAGLPLLNTESGFAGASAPAGDAAAETAAALLARSLVLGAFLGLDRFCQYAWDNERTGMLVATEAAPASAIPAPAAAPAAAAAAATPSAAAFASVRRWLLGTTLAGCRREPDSVVHCQGNRGDDHLSIWWRVPAQGITIVRIPLPGLLKAERAIPSLRPIEQRNAATASIEVDTVPIAVWSRSPRVGAAAKP